MGFLLNSRGKSALSLMNRDSSLTKVGIMRMKSTKSSSGALESLKVEPFLLSPFRSKDLYKLSVGDRVPKRHGVLSEGCLWTWCFTFSRPCQYFVRPGDLGWYRSDMINGSYGTWAHSDASSAVKYAYCLDLCYCVRFHDCESGTLYIHGAGWGAVDWKDRFIRNKYLFLWEGNQ